MVTFSDFSGHWSDIAVESYKSEPEWGEEELGVHTL